jgi:SAM-dependent methyltransferase
MRDIKPSSKHLKILLISHSTDHGGAQKALLHLLDQLIGMGHQCSVLFPGHQGGLVEACHHRTINCFSFPYGWALPVPSNELLGLGRPALDRVIEELKSKRFDLIISNTIVLLIGCLLAERMNLPHSVYISELIEDDANLRPRGICTKSYLHLIDQRSSGWLTCSESVKDRLVNTHKLDEERIGVLYPYSSNQLQLKAPAWLNAKPANNSPWHLVLIGEQSRRKHPGFGVLVLNAMRLRGHNIVLDHFGIQGDASQELLAMIHRLGMADFMQIHGWSSNPLSQLSPKSIHLITAKSEPFGLTVPECIEQGIPVIASRCGGPEELLPEEWLFPVDDLESCVYTLEALLVNLKKSEEIFNNCAMQLQQKLDLTRQIESLDNWLTKTMKAPRNQENNDPNIEKLWRLSQLDVSLRLSSNDLAPLVKQAAGLDDVQWNSLIAAEQKRPGTAVAIEMAHLGLCAHAYSDKLSVLYQDGNSFLIELLVSHGSGGRAEMSAFVMAALLDRLKPDTSRILAFGDGLGIDSLQLLNAGYEVDYIDIAGSRTAKASKAIINANASLEARSRIHFLNYLPTEPLYDAIVCLEVVEHVEQPLLLLESLCKPLKRGGFLVISECFAGIEPQWQTHLHTNLRYIGQLPAMLAQLGLELVDANLSPLAKPLVFRRCLVGELPSWSWSWDGLPA